MPARSRRSAGLGRDARAQPRRGLVLARTTPLDPPTALLGMIAGGASGIVGMSGELGADDRLVAFMQYLRVLVVVLLTPIGIAVFFGGDHGGGGGAAPSAGLLGSGGSGRWRPGSPPAGALARGRLRVTAGVLLGPMILTGAVVLAGLADGFAVPACSAQTAFALIGLQVGLRFTPGPIRLLGRLTVPGPAGHRRPAGGLLRARRPARRSRPRRRCSTPTWPPPPAGSTRCSRWPSARARTRRSSSRCRACASSRWCCWRRSRCAGCFGAALTARAPCSSEAELAGDAAAELGDDVPRVDAELLQQASVFSCPPGRAARRSTRETPCRCSPRERSSSRSCSLGMLHGATMRSGCGSGAARPAIPCT